MPKAVVWSPGINKAKLLPLRQRSRPKKRRTSMSQMAIFQQKQLY